MALEHRLIGDWVLEREIGSGSFAKVWRATHRATQQVAAVKEINMEKLNKKLLDSLRSEVTVLKHTKHHNIVCLLDLIQDTQSNRLFIVLEFCAGGDLGHYIKRYRQVSEATARYFLQQLAEGLKELRRHNVIHRDLKPQNLLLSDSSSTPLLKIADFGFARSLAPQGLAETLCGSPLYMAPEILQFHKYDAKADLWSIGTILFELLVGKPPFNGANHMQLLRNIERNEARLPEAVAARLSPACKGLLGRLLQRNPVQRITFEEFFQHPFLSGSGGAAAGVPPSQPIAAAVAPQPAPVSTLPAAMRQAAAAVTAAAAVDPGYRASGVGVPRPSLHLHGPPADAHQLAVYNSHAATLQYSLQQQEQQYQHQALRPWPQQQSSTAQYVAHTQQQQQQVQFAGNVQQQPPVPAVAPLPPPRPQQQQQQQQAPAHLVSRPVNQHPLAPESSQKDSELELMSDSMEGDFVVVHNPTGSAAQARSSSNSSSKGSSGLVDPKAAAVLAGAPGGRAPWQAPAEQQQQQQQHQLYQQQQQPDGLPHPGAWPSISTLPQPQGTQYLPVGSCTAAAADMESASPWMGMACGLPAGSLMPQSAALSPPTASQRVQLLVQVVRSCACLLARQEPGAGAGEAACSATQDAEQLAVMLLALQLVQALCLPHSMQEEQQDLENSRQDSSKDGASLATFLAAASQADLEQLMAGAVELLQLAKSMPGLAGSVCGDDEGDHAGAVTGAGLGRLAGSLMALPLPDPFGVLHKYALGSCRAAAVEEVMGNWQASMAGYSLAADLLLFLSFRWPQLGPADPALLPEERAALHKLYAAVNTRLAAVVAEASSTVMH